MRSSAVTWVCRVLWATLPLTLGEVFSRSLTRAATPAPLIWQLVLWALWVVVLGALFVPAPNSLTFVRICIPLAVVLGVGFGLAGGDEISIGILGVLGLAQAAAVAVLVMSGEVGAEFVDGPSYGDERRLGLRPPGFLILGPLQLLWVLSVGPGVAAVAFAAASKWIPALISVAVAVPSTWYAFRLLNRLARRCLVLVPAGMTLVDDLSLAEPTLFRREDIARLGPAPVDSTANDLSAGATGLLISADFTRSLSIVPAAVRGRPTEAVEVGGVLLALSRPGQLLDEAEKRRINVERR